MEKTITKLRRPIPAREWCDQCAAISINGAGSHETGCPNEQKTRMEDGTWKRFYDCFVCGCPVEEGESCDCQNLQDEEDTEAEEEEDDD